MPGPRDVVRLAVELTRLPGRVLALERAVGELTAPATPVTIRVPAAALPEPRDLLEAFERATAPRRPARPRA